MSDIQGTIYQMKNAAGNENRFPITVIEAVLGLSSYLQQQFSNLSTLYMGINDVALSGTTLTVKGTSVNLATVTDLSNYYTKTETDGRYLQLTGGTMSNTNLVTNLNADKLDNYHLADILAMDITGNAKTATNPKSELKTGQEFVFRKTNVEWDAKSGVMKKIKGKTLAWNQVVAMPEQGDAHGWLYLQNPTYNADGSFTLTPADDWGGGAYDAYAPIVGHKYYVRSGIQCTGIIRIFMGGTYITGDSLYPTKTYVSAVFEATSVQSLSLWGTQGVPATFWDIVAIDLTLLYGSALDGMTDAEILAKYEADFGTGYHPYTPGTLISNDADAVETTGANQWDGNRIEGYALSAWNGNLVSDNVSFVTDYVPVIAGQTYYFSNSFGINSGARGICYYDAGKNRIDGSVVGETGAFTRTVPSGARYMRATGNISGISAAIINLHDSAFDGSYEPYKKSRINLGLKNIKVVSPNVWDEEWEVGRYDEYGAKITGPSIRSKNLFPIQPSQIYYVRTDGNYLVPLFYDANKNCLGNAGTPYLANNTITAPSNARYMAFWMFEAYGTTTYNHDICINLSNPAINGRYFPYGTLNLEGGLRSGSNYDGTYKVYDYIQDNKLHRKFGVKNGDSLILHNTSSADFKTYKVILTDGTVVGASAQNQVNSFGIIYNGGLNSETVDYETIQYNGESDKTYYISFNPGRNVEDFKLYYELQYEEVYDLAEPLPSVYPCDQFGTERVISPVSVNPSAPFCADIQYGAKSDDVANDLIGTRDAVQPLLDALQYDGPNHAWHLKGNLYADGFVTAGGINSGATPIVIAPVVYEVDNWAGTVGKTDSTTWSQIAAKYGQGYNVQIDNTDGALYSVIGDDGDGTLYLSGGCTLIVDTE